MAGLLDILNRNPGLLSAMPRNDVLAPALDQTRALLATPVPVADPAPTRGRVNPLRVVDNFLFDGNGIGAAVEQERTRLDNEADRPRLLQQQAKIREYVSSLPMDQQIAYATAPAKLGEAYASRQEGRVLDQGDVYLRGENPVYGAAFEAAPGSSVFNPLNPTAPISVARSEPKVAGGALVDENGKVLYRGPQVEGVASTADAFYTPEVQQGQGGGAPAITRQARPDGYTLAPGQQRYENGAIVAQSTAPRPMTAVQQRQLREDQDAVQGVTGINQRLGTALEQINNGKLNFGPLANASAGVRNAIGMSDENSRNQASFRANLESLRNESLRLNAGVQTDGDAQRAWNELFANLNDEGVVKQRLGEIVALNERAVRYRSDRIADATQGQPASGAAAPASSVSREAALAEARRRGLIR